MSRRLWMRGGAAACVGMVAGAGYWVRAELWPRRLWAVEPGRIFRGAWQRPRALRKVIAVHEIRTVVTLTAINRDDPKYVAQDPVLRATGVTWRIVPMKGSTATIEQLDEASALVADRGLQPVFFHCVGGHHRSNLVHAAYRIRHQGWTARQAWDELAGLPWTRPDRDADDRRLIERYEEHVRAGQGLAARPEGPLA